MYYDQRGNPIRVDEAGIAMLEQSRREHRNRLAAEKRELAAKAWATMFPAPPPPQPTPAQLEAFHAAPSEQRGAYYNAVVSGNAEAAKAAGAVFGFSADFITHDLKSDWANAQREQIKAQAAAEEQARYEQFKAKGTLTDAQARFAAAMKLPQSKTGDVPADETISPGERLKRRGALSPGQSAFANSLELPPQ